MSYNPLKDEIFLPIPLKIAKRKDLSDRAKLVYGYLLRTLGKFKECRVSMAKISKELNIHRVTISKCITELKNKRLIAINKTGKASVYDFLPVDDVTDAITTDVTDAITTDVTDAITSPINREVSKELLKESDKATPDFLKKMELWRSIPIDVRRDLNKKQVLKCSPTKIEYAIERMNSGRSPVRAFQDALKGDHAKLARRMENKAIADQKQHEKDIDDLIEEKNKIEIDKETRLKLVPKFKESIFGENYKNHSPSSIIELRSFDTFVHYEYRN